MLVLLALLCLMACTKNGSLTLDRTELVLENEAVRLIATVTPEQPLTWSSSNEKIVKVYEGYVVPFKNGSAVVTVSTLDGKLSAQCAVKVDGYLKDLSEKGTANCYIIPEGGRYKFKCTRGNNKEGNITGIQNVRVLWESTFSTRGVQEKDLVAGVNYEDGWVYVQTGKEEHGNAVIAVEDDLGNALWSWHLWFCKGFVPENYQQTYKDGSIWMDRNLGASTYSSAAGFGLMYQWGRKDPFPGPYNNSGSKAPVSRALPTPLPAKDQQSAAGGVVGFARKNPTVFLKSPSKSDKWCLGSELSELWSVNKTINDPCPLGWRVPANIWKDAAQAESYSAGRVQDWGGTLGYASDLGSPLAGLQPRTLTYPAAGYYDFEGNLVNVTTEVKVWSCTVYNNISVRALMADGTSADFGSSKTPVVYGAASVRCVKDE